MIEIVGGIYIVRNKVTGYVEIPVIMPTVTARFPLVRGLEDGDLYEVQSRALEEVLEEAAARRKVA